LAAGTGFDFFTAFLELLAIVRWDIGILPVRINFGDHATSRRIRPIAGPAARKSFACAQSRRQCAIRVAKSCGHK
jgi:hypothetical protein